MLLKELKKDGVNLDDIKRAGVVKQTPNKVPSHCEDLGLKSREQYEAYQDLKLQEMLSPFRPSVYEEFVLKQHKR